MPNWKLSELIRASGGAGSAGQTFASNVTGAGANVSMQQYRITSMGFAGNGSPGTPAPPPAQYADNTTFNMRLDVVRGSQANQIQNQLSSAFTLSGAASGASYTLTNFSVVNNGAAFTFGVNVRGPIASYSASPSIVYNNGQGGGSQPPDQGVEWTGYFYLVVTSSGGGTTDMNLGISYTPNKFGSNFNDTVSETYPIRVENREYTASDFETRWWNYESDANANDVNSANASTSWWSYNQSNHSSSLYGYSGPRVWMRYRNVTANGSWSAVYALTVDETRVM